MAEIHGYSPYNLGERIITAGRLFLAVLLTAAFALDSAEHAIYPPIVHSLAFAYLVYSLVIAALTWTRPVTTRGVEFVTHAVDLLLFSAFMHLTSRVVLHGRRLIVSLS